MFVIFLTSKGETNKELKMFNHVSKLLRVIQMIHINNWIMILVFIRNIPFHLLVIYEDNHIEVDIVVLAMSSELM